MAALSTGDNGQGPPRHHPLAECYRIPVVVTNQVRSQGRDEASRYMFQVQSRSGTIEDPSKLEFHLVAALGIQWAHAVSIRLVLESRSGCKWVFIKNYYSRIFHLDLIKKLRMNQRQRLIKVAKSSISPSLGFYFDITSSGISLLNDEGVEMVGPEANTIHCQGHSGLIKMILKQQNDPEDESMKNH
ncbi:hypothetical protein OROGR_027732 [Orobanche gracilis]